MQTSFFFGVSASVPEKSQMAYFHFQPPFVCIPGPNHLCVHQKRRCRIYNQTQRGASSAPLIHLTYRQCRRVAVSQCPSKPAGTGFKVGYVQLQTTKEKNPTACASYALVRATVHVASVKCWNFSVALATGRGGGWPAKCFLSLPFRSKGKHTV